MGFVNLWNLIPDNLKCILRAEQIFDPNTDQLQWVRPMGNTRAFRKSVAHWSHCCPLVAVAHWSHPLYIYIDTFTSCSLGDFSMSSYHNQRKLLPPDNVPELIGNVFEILLHKQETFIKPKQNDLRDPGEKI